VDANFYANKGLLLLLLLRCFSWFINRYHAVYFSCSL